MYCCLGCRACETACPSGVQFGKLIEAAREQIQIETARTPLLSVPKQEVAESLTARLLRSFFFDLMLPSRMATSLVFAALKVYQRSGLQTIVRRLGLLDAVNALPTPLQGHRSCSPSHQPERATRLDWLLPQTLLRLAVRALGRFALRPEA